MNAATTTLPEASPIHSDPEIMSGVPVFIGTRVPAQILFDYLADGYDLEVFLDNFPTVKREQALKLLELASKLVSSELALAK